MKKIVFVLGNYKNGGMAMHATNLANEFALHDYNVDILVTGEIGDKSFLVLNHNVNVISMDEYNKDVSLPRKYMIRKDKKIKWLKRIQHLSIMRCINENISFEIKLSRAGNSLRYYFINNPRCTVIAFGAPYIKESLAAVTGLHCNVLYAEKSAPEHELPKNSNAFNFYIHLLRRVKAVVVQTHSAKEYYKPYLKNIYLINNPINPALPFPDNRKRTKRIVNFCRISPEKNIELLLNAFEKFHLEYSDYCVEIYGNVVSESEKDYKKNLLNAIKNKGLTSFFRLLPAVSDVHNKVLDAAMFISTSIFEGLSNSMIEAMAIGLPCICTDCLGGGTREVIEDHENGLIVPTNDSDALYYAMKELVDNPMLAKKCSKNAIRIRERLDITKIAGQWLEVIEKS